MTSSSSRKAKASQSQSNTQRRSPRKAPQIKEKPQRFGHNAWCVTFFARLASSHVFGKPEFPAPQNGIPIDGPQDSPFGPQIFLNTSVGAAQATSHTSQESDINPGTVAQVELVIDPQLMETPQVHARHPELIRSDGELDACSLREVSPTPAAGSSPIRRRPSNVQPIYGFVEGAGRGGMRLSVARVRELQPAFSDVSKATRKYEEWVKDLLTRNTTATSE
ncbi:hypothetical protein BKA70DRAFT_1453547 [Coprinopsis sp. MPI-PUGE-AT-0042]|nr:hypothetical protein BKA70DRAFT_1453547 [Coprinopsis sp. MPI-PUGE-AT-0042]